jgi:hypothetical protein
MNFPQFLLRILQAANMKYAPQQNSFDQNFVCGHGLLISLSSATFKCGRYSCFLSFFSFFLYYAIFLFSVATLRLCFPAFVCYYLAFCSFPPCAIQPSLAGNQPRSASSYGLGAAARNANARQQQLQQQQQQAGSTWGVLVQGMVVPWNGLRGSINMRADSAAII